MTKLTDNEIKKALECCVDDDFPDCSNCPSVGCYEYQKTCAEQMKLGSLDLINRLEADREAMHNDVKVAEEYAFNLKKELETTKAENKRLKEEVASHKDLGERMYIRQKGLIEYAKAEARKEFAERFVQKAEKTKIIYIADTTIQEQETGWYQISIADFDNLLKEMEGEQ